MRDGFEFTHSSSSFLLLSQVFSGDQKLAHYAKIPSKLTFFAQIGATILAALVQIGVQTWMFSHVPNMSVSLFSDLFSTLRTTLTFSLFFQVRERSRRELLVSRSDFAISRVASSHSFFLSTSLFLCSPGALRLKYLAQPAWFGE